LGPVDRQSLTHAYCCTNPENIRGLTGFTAPASYTLTQRFNSSFSNYMESLSGFQSSAANETTTQIRHTLGYTTKAEFINGVVSGEFSNASGRAYSGVDRTTYRWQSHLDPYVISLSEQGVVSGTSTSFTLELPTFGYVYFYHPEKEVVGPSYSSPGWPASEAGWVYTQPLCSALGIAWDPDAGYPFSVRTKFDPAIEGLYSFTLPICGEIRPDPPNHGSAYIFSGTGSSGIANDTIPLLITATLTYQGNASGLQLTAGALTNPFGSNIAKFQSAAPDEKDWRRRDEFSFDLDEDVSTIVGATGDLDATRNACALP